MRSKALMVGSMACAVAVALRPSSATPAAGPEAWNHAGAVAYLDQRIVSWSHGGAMDHGTFCISCHTGVPYALGLMREESPAQHQLLANVTWRVEHWNEISPYLGDKRAGRQTESVINAFVLANRDRLTGHASPEALQALKTMWAEQIDWTESGPGGPYAGAWRWIDAGNEPWEAPDSEYWGATLAAFAVAQEPGGYMSRQDIRHQLSLLKSYLRQTDPNRSLFNRLSLLWASNPMPGILDDNARTGIVRDVLARQLPDGGWSTASLLPPTWCRRDGLAPFTTSDGFGTAYVAYVLGEDHLGGDALRRARTWLQRNQDPLTGAWLTKSPNSPHDPSTDPGKFMSDAATAYASLALR